MMQQKLGTMPDKLPLEFRSRLEAELPAYAAGLVSALETTDPSVAARLNPAKPIVDGVDSIFSDALDRVPWCDDGRYFSSRPDFTHDPALHQGCYYVQDASSMAMDRILRRIVPGISLPDGCRLRYLDACAAPGGKTTAAISALRDVSCDPLVVANEFDFRRAEILKENLIKWGYEGCVVARGDTSRLRKLPGFFHVVAADVPCSGEGMMRKDPKAVAQWSPALVDQCAARQREIVSNLWDALAPGGYMVYSTCTFNVAENERIIDFLVEECGAQPMCLDAGDFPGAIWTGSMLRFLPSLVRGEGLAIGVVRKPDGDMADFRRRNRKQKGDAARGGEKGSMKNLKSGCGCWLRPDVPVEIVERENTLTAVPTIHADEMRHLASLLDVIHMGVPLGEVKGKNVVPGQSLAMSGLLNREAFPGIEVDLPTALSYLRREALGGFDAPRGCVLLGFGGQPLGFVNHLGNRSNNLYPPAWRILH